MDALSQIISTIAGGADNGFSGDGGPATGSLLNFPWGVKVDATGTVYVADHSNQRIRMIANVYHLRQNHHSAGNSESAQCYGWGGGECRGEGGLGR